MQEFRGKRVAHEYVQNNVAPPERVFPLLCPVREADWVPGWAYELIYSKSGVAELGCVFNTLSDDGQPTVWMVTEYDPQQFVIGFAWVLAGLVATRIRISLERDGAGTRTHIHYVYTGLSTAGNQEIERYDQDWFIHKMTSWQTAINHYLQTGRKVEAGTWE